MQQLQRPLVTLSARCKLPVTLPQLMGLMQNAQQCLDAPAALPGVQSTAQKVGPPTATAPTQSSAASSVSQGVGALPVPPIAGLPRPKTA